MDTPQAAVVLESNVTVAECSARGGEWGMWLLPHGCAVAYDGPMCHSCVAGWVRTGSAGQGPCVKCGNHLLTGVVQAAWSLGLLGVALLLIHRTLYSLASRIRRKAILRMIFYHMQVLGALSFVSSTCGSGVATGLDWVSGAVSGTSALQTFGCVTGYDGGSPVALHKTAWAYMTTTVMFVLWWSIVTCKWGCRKHQSSQQELHTNHSDLGKAQTMRAESLTSMLVPSILAVLARTYPSVVRAVATMMSCTSIYQRGQMQVVNAELLGVAESMDQSERLIDYMKTGWLSHRRLADDMKWECWTGDHLAWMLTWVLPVGALHVGITLGLTLYVLWLIRRTAKLTAAARAWHLVRFGWLYQGYASNPWYWGLVNRVSLVTQVVGAVGLSSTSAGLGAWRSILICAARLALNVALAPYGSGHGSRGLQTIDAASSSALLASATAFWYIASGGEAGDLRTCRNE